MLHILFSDTSFMHTLLRHIYLSEPILQRLFVYNGDKKLSGIQPKKRYSSLSMLSIRPDILIMRKWLGLIIWKQKILDKID